MSKLLPAFKKYIIEDIKNNIVGNTAHYYAFAANPKEYVGSVPTITDDDYTTNFLNNFLMLFGKKINGGDIFPVINKNTWAANTKYDRYDNTSTTLYTNNNFYVVTTPSEVGGEYYIYKCIDNNGGSFSNTNPSSIGTPKQPSTFTTADGYKWRYITSISSSAYDKFSTNEYIPIYKDNIITASSLTYSGVEVVVVSNSGSGYDAYCNGTILSVVNSTLIQIGNTSDTISTDDNFYNNNSIYIYNVIDQTAQIATVNNYESNGSGKWAYLSSPANTSIIYASSSKFILSPKVVFNTDGKTQPIAYSTVNTSTNSIQSIVILDIGSNITRANVSLETSYGSGANLYCIVPPPGGHGYSPETELNVKGLSIAFSFSNNELSTIVTSNVVYNKIGLIKNPYSLLANNTKGSIFTSNTFSQILKANVNPSYTFSIGEDILGSNSGARGIVAFANSTQVYIVGDKTFSNNEYVGNTSSANLTQITINTLGDVYDKELIPFYIQNINNINRSNTQTESFKVIIQV